MPKIAGVVIAYFPDLNKLIRNIDTYIDYIEQLFIVFNSPAKNDVIELLTTKYSTIQVIVNEKNIGIASALNRTALKAMNQGYDWLLTMDQDSRFSSVHFFEAFGKSDMKNVAIFCPTPDSQFRNASDNFNEAEEVLTVITSGNLLNLSIWKILGGFEEKLFIDEVDNDYCLKAVFGDFKIVRFKNISFIHELGLNKEVFFLLKKHTIITHSPVRAYYIFRNNFYIFSKYKKIFPEFVRSRKIVLLKVFIKILLFSENRIQYCRYVLAGIKDYFKSSYGSFNGNAKEANSE